MVEMSKAARNAARRVEEKRRAEEALRRAQVVSVHQVEVVASHLRPACDAERLDPRVAARLALRMATNLARGGYVVAREPQGAETPDEEGEVHADLRRQRDARAESARRGKALLA